MTLIKSISGIRGTIGGEVGEGLTPIDITRFISAYAKWVIKQSGKPNPVVVLGRDARISGEMVTKIALGTLQGMGIDIIHLGLSTTPTVEVAVAAENADGGIILTASHNPVNWNALKLLNAKGEFISAADGAEILKLAASDDYEYAEVTDLGVITENTSYIDKHIAMILDLTLVDKELIAQQNYTVAVDCVNSTGGLSVPPLLKALGVAAVVELYTESTGEFPHNPEPLAENLTELSGKIVESNAHVGFAVDPDVDRLAIVSENGEMFGEEYTLVAVADYVLANGRGNTVSNLSSTRALRDVTEKAGGRYYASAVGEVNVVEMMKKENAAIGGEGNGGVIYPELHYGRDALVGIALFLTHMAKKSMKCSELRATYNNYYISKNKIELTPEIDVDDILAKMEGRYSSEDVISIDGVKISFGKEWVHLRKSNTEPIIRVYAESDSEGKAATLANKIIDELKEMIN
ncbi:MAG TPA: phosphoglucosamine mutase [Flavobacteriales bacterium]|nr:phosphoglucosamine mutase [Flavobacteriales bacterium]HIA10563.1 phosphoglucosamine mutase [Flavobacteriales bacterium]